ncbi:hypothetical protein BD770DRAFT_450006 [Pilaira anomala]|nr:hypothetical protein BD770DRAFT_450006 [Pilaira anomala]
MAHKKLDELREGNVTDEEEEFFSGDDEDFEEEEEEEQESSQRTEQEDPFAPFVDNTAIPTDPLSLCLFLMVVTLYGRYLTDEGIEIVMAFLNVALEICGSPFRFPKKVAAFIVRCQLAERVHHSIKEYVSCKICHAVHAYSTPTEKQRLLNEHTCSSKEPFINSVRCDAKLFKKVGNKMTPIHGFVNSIKQWKNRQSVPGVMGDIYDGRVWNTFKLNEQDDQPFVQQSIFNLVFSINIDWFSLYEYGDYSCEPATFQMNHYLKLVVDELLLLASGVHMQTLNDGVQLVKGALTLVTCDLPATRKVVGMTSFNSKNACNRCDTIFEPVSGTKSKINFSTGLDEEEWNMRTNEKHRSDAERWLNTRTRAARTDLERENGTRYSELLRLNYFDPTRFVAFDICHNIFMGTASRMATSNEKARQSTDFVLPFGYDGASISKKIDTGKGFSRMKSDEFKTWTLAMSPYLLKLKLTDKYYKHWMNFVEATRYLSSPTISLLEFVSVYKDEALMVSNMHFHLHLRDTLLDYGPGPSSWVFNFERYNCDIKNIRTNRKDCVEYVFEAIHENCLKELLAEEYNDALERFSLDDYLSCRNGHTVSYGFEILPPITFYKKMYTCQDFDRKVFKADRIGDMYKSEDPNVSKPRGSYIRAFYRTEDEEDEGEVEEQVTDIYHTISRSGVLRPAQIKFFFRHQVEVLGNDGQMEKITHTFAYVKWFSNPYNNFSSFSKDHMQVWGNWFDEDSVMSILPVSRIYSPVTIMKNHLDDSNVILGLPPKVFF